MLKRFIGISSYMNHNRILFIVLLAFCQNLMTAQILNDFCESAIIISDPRDYCSEIGEFTNVGATESGIPSPMCFPNGEEDNDVWFTFVAQATFLNIRVIGNTGLQPGGTLNNPEAALYAGNCSNLNEVECISDAFDANVVESFTGPLAVGARYYLRINARNGFMGTFQLCLINFNQVPEPSGDCPTGVILCDKNTFTVEKVLGEGNDANEYINSACNNTTTACIMDERNSTWYKWTCLDPGSLTFDITPLNPVDDIDFVFYELPNGIDDCSEKIELRCMLSGENVGAPQSEWEPCTGPTGLSLSDSDTGETCGCQPGDNNFVSAIEMEAGKVYAIGINNFSGSGNGFSLSFGGTGTFAGPVADFDINPVEVQCDREVTITDLSTYVNGTIASRTWFFAEDAIPPTASGVGPHLVTFPSIGTKLVVLTLETEEGCLVTEILELEVLECCAIDSDINLGIGNPLDPNCANTADGSFDAIASGGDPAYSYSLNGGPFQPNANFLNLQGGTYDVEVIDIKGCVDDATVTLTPPPPLIVDAGPDQTVDLGFSTTISATVSPSGSVVTTQWIPDTLLSCSTCLNLSLTPPGQTTYTIEVVDEDGCIATDEITIFVRDNRPVYIPNAFTPNGDGINDFFSVFAGPASTQVNLMQIYDRWGELVWEKEDFPINAEIDGWDGKFRGQQSHEGVYVYYALIGFIDGKELLFEGDLTLLR